MNVEDNETRILEYLEGELSEENERAFREEIERSPELQELLKEFQDQDRLLHGYFDAHSEAAASIPKPSLGATDSARVKDVARSHSLKNWMGAAAVLVVLAGSGYVLYSQETVTEGLDSVVYTEGRSQAFRINSNKPVALQASNLTGLHRLKTPEKSKMAATLLHGLGTIELNENTLASVEEIDDTVTVALDRGELLLEAERPVDSNYTVRVVTPDFELETEDGTVGVTRGLRGSEVGVLFGEVELRLSSGARKTLRRGDTFSSTGVRPMPLFTRVEWSKNSEQLLAMVPKNQREEAVAAVATAPPAAPENVAQVASATESPSETTMTNEDAVYTEPAIASASSAATATASNLALNTSAPALTTRYLPSGTFALLELTNLGNSLQKEGVNNLGEVALHENVKSFIGDSLGNALEDDDRPGQVEVAKRLDNIFSNEDARLILSSLNGATSVGLTPGGPFLVAQITDNDYEMANMVQYRLEPYFKEGIVGQNGKRLRAEIANGKLLIGVNGERFEESLTAMQTVTPTGFVNSTFLTDLRKETSGSYLTAALDMKSFVEGVVRRDSNLSRNRHTDRFLHWTGLDNMQTIVAATSFTDQAENMGLRVTFEEEREGIMSWIGEPGPLSSFQFYSPDTHAVFATRVKAPVEMLRDMVNFTRGRAPGSAESLRPLEEDVDELIIRLADTLGNEVSFGLDNPVLPVPNVKGTVEVLDPIEFQNGMLDLITKIWEVHTPDREGSIDVKTTTYRNHLIVDFDFPSSSWDLSYAIVDDYVVLGPGRPFLQSSIDAYVEDQSLAQDYSFLEALPAKSGSFCSSLFYATVNDSMGDALPYLETILAKYELPLSVNAFTHRPIEGSNAAVYYTIAEDDRIDLFANGVKGERTMSGVLPAVANWLEQ